MIHTRDDGLRWARGIRNVLILYTAAAVVLIALRWVI